MENRAEQQLQTALDKEAYNEADLITLTIPLSLPYVTDTKGFERLDGEITLEGKIYHYVKRGIKGGALVLLCLPDHQKMKLESAKREFYKLAGDFQQTKPSKKNNKADLFKDIRAKYCPRVADREYFILPIGTLELLSPYLFHPLNSQSDLPDQPPELS